MVSAKTHSRRLWELDPAAHDLLLAGSFTAPELRALVERSLSRLHRVRCVLDGSDADVLYSAVHDLGSRNPLSEALHDALALRHGPTAARWRALKDAAALQEAWRELVLAGAVATSVADLWGLLTHPAESALKQVALYDYRQRVLTLARGTAAADHRAQQAATELADQRSRFDTQQRRLLALQQSVDLLNCRLAAAEAMARGAMQRADIAEARLAEGLRRTPHAVPAPDASAANLAPSGPETSAPEPDQRFLPVGLMGQPPEKTAISIEVAPPQSGRKSLAMAGRRLLCVGGMPGSRQRYRALVEAAGARFDYHDGGIEDNVIRLDSQLAAADVVVCHSACLNHEAYHRIKGHCQRHDKPCVYLARPSLSFFARELGLGRYGRTT